MRVPSSAYTSEASIIDGFSNSFREGREPKTPKFISTSSKMKRPRPAKKIFQNIGIALRIFLIY
jgi:hypothetical protein